METLYDLLGALPRDDADELRAAFRRAVKGAHPDINPDDPDAGQKFREIVRANEILGDEEQRAAYDHLLGLAHKEQKQQATAKTMHKAATRVIALVVATGVSLGGYLTYQNVPKFSGSVKHWAELFTARPSDFAALPPAYARPQPKPVQDAQAETAPPDTNPQPAQAQAQQAEVQPAKLQIASAEPPPSEKAPAAEKVETADAAPATIAAPVAPPPPQGQPENAATAVIGPPLEIAPSDPKVYRERGIFAYRSGDLDGAVAEFDRAIQLDPKSSAAYIDRGIVLYRLQKFERAFADIAHAKRIEKQNRAKAAQQAAAKKPKQPPAAVALGFPPLFQHRTAKLE